VTITFPQGRIIKDTAITQIGTGGYWVETPANVTPVVTKSANRYEENPSFGETFENYKLGAFTSIKTSIDTSLYPAGYRPDTYWTVSGTASIVENSGSKAMALTGTTTLTNASGKTTDSSKNILTVPSQITAGDSYAQQQAWEVAVTMPSSFSGTIDLLNYVADDGFRIDDKGKVHYPGVNTDGSFAGYAELGLSLTAGQTYTFKRVLDFTAKTCDYNVYDASGTLLSSVTGKQIINVTTPVTKIYMSTTGVSGAVTVDDYKLYPVGVTANLELYEELTLSKFSNYTGYVRKLSNTTAVRTAKTSYRVSWLNNSGEYKYAVLKNSKTGAVIEQVLMAPGDSGYFNGSVNASASAPVTFALTTESATAPGTPNYDNGDFSWTAEAAERIGLAVGQKLAYTGGDAGGNSTGGPEDGSSSGDTGNGSNGGGASNVPGDNGSNGGNADHSGNSGDAGEENPADSGKKGMSGGIIALIVILSLAALAGGGVAVYIFIVKPRLFARSQKETTEE